MDNELIKVTYALKMAIDNDERMIRLNQTEKAMEDSEEVMSLSYKKDMALERYNEILKYFKDDSEEANKARRLLSEAKAELEKHPLVREYLSAYQQVRLMYEKINNTLFSYLNSNLCPHEVRK